MFKKRKLQQGIVQIPVIIGLIIIGIALPAALKLTQETRETRGGATGTVIGYSCQVYDTCSADCNSCNPSYTQMNSTYNASRCVENTVAGKWENTVCTPIYAPTNTPNPTATPTGPQPSPNPEPPTSTPIPSGTLTPTPCSPGDVKCEGTKRMVCADYREWIVGIDCAESGKVCSDEECRVCGLVFQPCCPASTGKELCDDDTLVCDAGTLTCRYAGLFATTTPIPGTPTPTVSITTTPAPQQPTATPTASQASCQSEGFNCGAYSGNPSVCWSNGQYYGAGSAGSCNYCSDDTCVCGSCPTGGGGVPPACNWSAPVGSGCGALISRLSANSCGGCGTSTVHERIRLDSCGLSVLLDETPSINVYSTSSSGGGGWSWIQSIKVNWGDGNVEEFTADGGQVRSNRGRYGQSGTDSLVKSEPYVLPGTYTISISALTKMAYIDAAGSTCNSGHWYNGLVNTAITITSPTPTPNPNCTGNRVCDVNTWIDDFISGRYGYQALTDWSTDINCDTKVDLRDYEMIRRSLGFCAQ